MKLLKKLETISWVLAGGTMGGAIGFLYWETIGMPLVGMIIGTALGLLFVINFLKETNDL
jgi:hypothetical protein